MLVTINWNVGIKIKYLQACTSTQYVVVCRVLPVVIFKKETKDRRSRNELIKVFYEFWTLLYCLDKK